MSSSFNSSNRWLSSSLPRHSIWELPPSSSAVSELARPASPDVSAILPQSTSSSLFSASRTKSSPFKSTSSRSDKSHSKSALTKRDSGIQALDPSIPARKSRLAVARGSDLILAVGSELRIASLTDVKARCQQRDTADGLDDDDIELGDYKTLKVPSVTFEIQRLVLNPSAKLLAVVGVRSVAVVVLPRKGWSTAVGHTLDCRSLLVGRFYHSLPGSPSVAQVLWHPWGVADSSLLVLTSDATVREYMINDDAEEPAQTISFLKSKPTPSLRPYARGFSADDEDASVAVSFCIGEGQADWGPLTLYGLMRNGDILAICPFLPARASVPAAYLQALSCFVSTKVDYLAQSTSDDDGRELDLAASISTFKPDRSWSSTPSRGALALSTTSSVGSVTRGRSTPLSKLYSQQLQYVNSLVRQLAATPAATLDGDDSLDVDLAQLATSSRPVPVRPPAAFTSSRRPPAPQGPFLLQPEPADLENGADSRACDLVHVQYRGKTSGNEKEESLPPGDGIGLLVVSFSDGKVDLCMEVEKVEANWSTGDDSYDASLRIADDGESSGPSLLVLESIDLGLAREVAPEADADRVERALATNWSTIVRDPLYDDTLYVHHAYGAHCLVLSQWLDELVPVLAGDEAEDADEEAESKKLEKVSKARKPTDVAWILKTSTTSEGITGGSSAAHIAAPFVIGLCLVNDVYLGYSILMVTASLQFVGIELSLRVDSTLVPSASTSTSSKPLEQTRKITAEAPAYLSLLDEPFVVPEILSKRSAVSSVARLAGPTPGSGSVRGSDELKITPDTLRYLGKTVETFQTSIRDLVDGADVVQHRLELQMKELSRQLGKVDELKTMASSTSSSGKGTGSGNLASRLERTQATQAALLARTDRLLQRLMDMHSPTISTYERKWFDELDRLRAEERKLEPRVERLEAKVEELRPTLEELKRKADATVAAAAVTAGDKSKGQGRAVHGGPHHGVGQHGQLGDKQLALLESMLGDEAKLIGEARRKIERLTQALASSSLH